MTVDLDGRGKFQMDDPELARIERMLDIAVGTDDRTYAYLSLGVLGERRGDWDGAVESYSKALAEGSQHEFLCYFGNNNLGYSLIQLQRFEEAEVYCLTAIEVDPGRHNAHKNLGLVRQLQNRWLDAAFCFAEAYRLCPQDPRAWHLLTAILSSQPALLADSPDLCDRIAGLRQDDEYTLKH
jgi:tetratricopeptide (TPR) repeat protein